MEKQPHEEYRDELANTLKEIRNSDSENPEISKAKAQGYLSAQKETKEYQDASTIHRNEVQKTFLENASAEERLNTVWEELKDPLFTKEQLLSALNAIDEIYKTGLVLNPVNGPFETYKIQNGLDELTDCSVSDYDWDAMQVYVRELQKPLFGVVENIRSLPRESSHIDRIFDYDSGFGNGRVSILPSKYDYEKRGNFRARILSFIDKFKKSPEKIAKEKADKQQSIKDAEFKRFDPSI